MSNRFSLESILTLTDGFTGPMKKASGNVVTFSRSMQRSFSGLNNTIDRTNRKINAMANTRVATAGMAGLTVGVGLAAREYIKFDDAIYGATARFKDAQVAGANVEKIMKSLRVAARKTGADTQFSAAQASQGLDFFARAGFTSKEAIKSLKSVIDLTTVSGEEFARVSDISSDLLGSFGYAALDSGKKIKKLKDLNNTLAIAVNASNVKLEDLFETLKEIGPISNIAGAGMKEVVAMTAMLGGAGIKGTVAATAIKNAYLRLGEMGPKIRKGLSMVGLGMNDIADKKGNMRALPEILAKVGKGVSGMGTQKQIEIMSLIFGKRAIAGAKNIGDLSKQITELNEKMIKNKSASELAAEAMRKSMGNRLKILASTATELGFKFFEAFDGNARNGITSLTDTIRGINVNPLITTLKLVLGIIKVGYTILSPFLPLIVGIVIGVKAWVVAQKALVALQFAKAAAGWVAYLWMMRSAIIQAVAMTKIWTIVQGIFNAVMSVSAIPIGLIILGIAALVAAVYFLIKNWQVAKDFFLSFFAPIINSFIAPINFIKNKFAAVFNWILAKWAAVKEIFGFATDAGNQAVNVNQNIEGGAYRNPGTANSETTVNNKTAVDVNFNNAPSGTQIKRSGSTAPGTSLNLGVN